ncbi:g7132 [Coccomyxa viridis]|uniref:G7132 protein n=1 Tax=Coccomyxa viridis TaxID=1274662 RepID=A0ABP1G136_9CHLO
MLHREESEASSSLSTSSNDETSGLITPASDALPAGSPELYDNSEAERMLLQLGARWREMTKQPGAALPPEAAELQQQQISQLSASMRQARMRSTVELLGRKQLAPGEELPLTPADPASRILEALLNVPDQAERLQMLPEALQAPDPATAAAEEDLETELLWTTPVRLLQAIDVALLRMQRPTSGSPTGDKLLSDGNSERIRDVQKELQVLREEVFRIWDNESQ